MLDRESLAREVIRRPLNLLATARGYADKVATARAAHLRHARAAERLVEQFGPSPSLDAMKARSRDRLAILSRDLALAVSCETRAELLLRLAGAVGPAVALAQLPRLREVAGPEDAQEADFCIEEVVLEQTTWVVSDRSAEAGRGERADLWEESLEDAFTEFESLVTLRDAVYERVMELLRLPRGGGGDPTQA